MLERKFGFLETRSGNVPTASRQLHDRGYVLLSQALSPEFVCELREEIEQVFLELPPDGRPATKEAGEDDVYRYEMLNRSAACQRAVGHPGVLEVIEPLLGNDCHVIANTAWRNPAGQASAQGGQFWHIDAGPHVPRPPGTPWPAEIPYPVFAIGAHFLLLDSRLEDGPTGVIPGSHRSGRYPPFESMRDAGLRYEGEGCIPLLGHAGDVALFVSDIWHRRMAPQPGEQGRFFLQVHYGRRDIAQRLRTSSQSNQLSKAARSRAKTRREHTLIGLHDPQFYDG